MSDQKVETDYLLGGIAVLEQLLIVYRATLGDRRGLNVKAKRLHHLSDSLD